MKTPRTHAILLLLVCLSLGFNLILPFFDKRWGVSASDTGECFPQAASGYMWSNPEHVYADDGDVASYDPGPGTPITDEVYEIYLTGDGSTILSDNKGPSSDHTFGADDDTWNYDFSTYPIDSDFGVLVMLGDGGDQTSYFYAYDFDMTVPSGATIDGVIVNIDYICGMEQADIDYISMTVYYTTVSRSWTSVANKPTGTFGKTDAGASSDKADVTQTLFSTNYTLTGTSSRRITSLHAYASATEQNASMGIYNCSTYDRIAFTEARTITSAGWYQFNFTTPPTLPPGKYALVLWECEGDTGESYDVAVFYDDAGGESYWAWYISFLQSGPTNMRYNGDIMDFGFMSWNYSMYADWENTSWNTFRNTPSWLTKDGPGWDTFGNTVSWLTKATGYNTLSNQATWTMRPPTGWYNTAWTYRNKIIIDHTKVASSPLSNFPVMIYNISITNFAHAQADGDDFLFTNAAGTKLDHEIEYFHQASGKLVAWVEVPTISSSIDTTIYMYYGNPTCSSQQSVAGTWASNNWKAIYHMQYAPPGTMYDSTSNNNHMTSSGSMVSGDLVNGTYGRAVDFDGINDYYRASRSATMEPSTVSMLARWMPRSKTANFRAISKMCTDKWGNYDGASYGVGFTDKNFTGDYETNDNNANQPFKGLYNINSYVFEATTHNGVAGGTSVCYVNGSAGSPGVNPVHVLNYGGTTANRKFYVGACWSGAGGPGPNAYSSILVDEIWITSTVLSANDVTTLYNSQNNPTTFAIFQTIETPSLNGWNTFRNTASWTIEDGPGWSRFGNTASWLTKASGYNTFQNTSLWTTIDQGWNTFENPRSWLPVTDGWNTFGNTALFDDVEQGWNTFGNLSSWSSKGDGWNTFGNQSSWSTPDQGWNTFGNHSSYLIIDQGWNTFQSDRSWLPVIDGWNTFGNIASWTTIDQGWNTFSNQASYTNIDQGWNTFGNISGNVLLDQGWNTFQNNASWSIIDQGWNMFKNAEWTNVTDGYNTFGNISSFTIIEDGWDTFSNQASWTTIDDGWNTFGNGITWVPIDQGWNRFGNTSSYIILEQGWNTFGNNNWTAFIDWYPKQGDVADPTNFSFMAHIDDTNGTLMNLTWEYWNGTAWVHIATQTGLVNGTYYQDPSPWLGLLYNHTYRYRVTLVGTQTIVKVIDFTTPAGQFVITDTMVAWSILLTVFGTFLPVGYITRRRSAGIYLTMSGVVFMGLMAFLPFNAVLLVLMVIFSGYLIMLGVKKMFFSQKKKKK